jgi:hypothetical protein
LHGSSYLPLLVCCSHLLASIWLLSASDILRLKLLAGRGHHPCVLSFSVSTTTHSALPEASPSSQLPAESLLRRIASLPCVKCPVGQCLGNRSNQLCAALVHVPSNTSACSSCPASRVFLAIVLRLGTGYRGPEMNGGCHSYLVQDVPCYWVCGRSISAPVTPPPSLLPIAPTHSCNRPAEALARHMLQKKVFFLTLRPRASNDII